LWRTLRWRNWLPTLRASAVSPLTHIHAYTACTDGSRSVIKIDDVIDVIKIDVIEIQGTL
jgi:hypothetical protein